MFVLVVLLVVVGGGGVGDSLASQKVTPQITEKIWRQVLRPGGSTEPPAFSAGSRFGHADRGQ